MMCMNDAHLRLRSVNVSIVMLTAVHWDFVPWSFHLITTRILFLSFHPSDSNILIMWCELSFEAQQTVESPTASLLACCSSDSESCVLMDDLGATGPRKSIWRLSERTDTGHSSLLCLASLSLSLWRTKEEEEECDQHTHILHSSLTHFTTQSLRSSQLFWLNLAFRAQWCLLQWQMWLWCRQFRSFSLVVSQTEDVGPPVVCGAPRSPYNMVRKPWLGLMIPEPWKRVGTQILKYTFLKLFRVKMHLLHLDRYSSRI